MIVEFVTNFWEKHSMLVTAVVVMLALRFYLNVRDQKFFEEEAKKHSDTVTDITSEEQYDQIESIVVIDFYATWCPPCRRAAPIFAELSKQYKDKPIKFLKVDVSNQKALADR